MTQKLFCAMNAFPKIATAMPGFSFTIFNALGINQVFGGSIFRHILEKSGIIFSNLKKTAVGCGIFNLIFIMILFSNKRLIRFYGVPKSVAKSLARGLQF